MATKKTAAKKTAQTWNNVKGLMRLWATERGNKKKSWLSFSTSIGKKNEDEKYDNVYFDVLFKKNEAPEVDEGAFEINVKKGFLTLTVYSDGGVPSGVMVSLNVSASLAVLASVSVIDVFFSLTTGMPPMRLKMPPSGQKNHSLFIRKLLRSPSARAYS